MRSTDIVTRRAAIGRLGGVLLFGVAFSRAAAAPSPIGVAVTTKDLGSHVQVGVRVSVHVNLVNFDNFNLGSVNVPKGGKKILELVNPVGAIVQAVIASHGVIATVAVTVKLAGSVIASRTVQKTI